MRNLKRALSLALAMVMVLSMMVIGAGAASYDDFSDKDEIVNKEAVQMLVELGVINGKDDGTYDPTGIVTRAEMAKMICVVLNGGKDPSLGSTVTNSYTDTVAHWAAGYIEYCTQLGIVAGDGAGNFNPNATVTGSEAAKMLLVAMGYKSEVEGFTGANWAIAVNVRANQKGLYSDLSISVDAGLTRDSAAQMVYNALDAGIVSYEYTLVTDGSTISSSPTLIDNNSKTLLEHAFNAVKVEGVVVANEFANLSSTSTNSDYAKGVVGSALDEGKTKIVITNGDDQKVYTGTETFAVSSGKDVLGRSVVIYVKKATNAAKAEVLGSVITSTDNVVVVDYSGDSLKDVADDNDLSYTSKTQIAYNYASMADLTDTTVGSAGYEKIIVDTDDDGDVDYVLYNNYQLGKVTKYSTSSDGSITVSLASGSYTVDDKADVVGFDDVAKDDYVMATFFGGKLYVEAVETVTGTIEAYKNSSKNDFTTKLTIDGTDYSISNVPTYTGTELFAANKAFVDDTATLDTEATFYLDQQGYIVATGEVVESAYNFAYVIESSDATLEDLVKVVLSDGTKATYTLSDKSPVDIDHVVDGNVYAYTIDSKKEIKLTDVTDNGTFQQDTTSSAAFEKGKSTITVTGSTTPANDGKYFANNSTAFFYVNGDKVEVYTGRDAAPSVNSTTGATVVVNRSGAAAAVVFEGVVAKASVGDHMFVYSLGNISSDYINANVVLNGKDTTETVKVDASDKNILKADTLYTYTVNSDGYYEINTVAGEDFYKTGTVSRIYTNSVVTTAGEYLIDGNTVVIDNDGNPGTPDVALKGALAKGDEVQFLLDDDTIVMIVITKHEAEIPTEGEVNGNVTATFSLSGGLKFSCTNGYVPSDAEKIAAAKAAVAKALDVNASDVTVSVSGTTWTVGANGNSWNGTPAENTVAVTTADKNTHLAYTANWKGDPTYGCWYDLVNTGYVTFDAEIFATANNAITVSGKVIATSVDTKVPGFGTNPANPTETIKDLYCTGGTATTQNNLADSTEFAIIALYDAANGGAAKYVLVGNDGPATTTITVGSTQYTITWDLTW